jgi:hypothetical protein
VSTSNKPESSKQRLKELVISGSSSTINIFAFFTSFDGDDVDGDDVDGDDVDGDDVDGDDGGDDVCGNGEDCMIYLSISAKCNGITVSKIICG